MPNTPLNLYDEIANNKRKTVLIILLFPLVLAGLIFVTFCIINFAASNQPPEQVWNTISNYSLLITAITVGVALVWTLISWYTGDQIILNSANAYEISRSTHPEIFVLVENLTIATGLPLPRIYIIDDNSLNAFATGRDPEHASLALTRGIIKKLNRAELEGVIGHELGHIANRDIRLTMLVATSIGAISLMGQILIRTGRGKNSKGNFLPLIGLALIIYGSIFAPLIMYALSRRREYQADATSAYMTRDPASLASALEKISQDSRVEALDGKDSIAAACIAFPGDGKKVSLSSLFATHPPIKDRIAKLRAM